MLGWFEDQLVRSKIPSPSRRLYEGNPGGNSEPPPLVAREPQLAAARAELNARQAELRKALLDLERTELRAPFAGRVASEKVDAGQYVSPGQSLGTIYSTEAAEMVVPLASESLFWFEVPGFTSKDGRGAPAVVKASVAGRQLRWSGKVVRTEGKLDERTRMINVVVRVEKPYDKKPPLAFGLFVKVEIQGRTIPEGAIIPRAALHQGNIVWIVDGDSRLRFRQVEVARLQGDEAVVTEGLEDGEWGWSPPL